jgi:hypothetical protein
MQNLNDDGVEMMMFWQQSGEAEVQVYTEFSGQLV